MSVSITDVSAAECASAHVVAPTYVCSVCKVLCLALNITSWTGTFCTSSCVRAPFLTEWLPTVASDSFGRPARTRVRRIIWVTVHVANGNAFSSGARPRRYRSRRNGGVGMKSARLSTPDLVPDSQLRMIKWVSTRMSRRWSRRRSSVRDAVDHCTKSWDHHACVRALSSNVCISLTRSARSPVGTEAGSRSRPRPNSCSRNDSEAINILYIWCSLR
mmetsp:Transcript_54154/g.166625  ORF Transcript_54154/g.166625 Transcript_54154/m.166625 type:complete len:217 (-) Transcript_54154:362-1012(-)